MSPIFVRPVREQLEHDRLVRHLHLKYQQKFDVVMNVGDEQTLPVKVDGASRFPDLVLMSGKRMAGLVEVETGESVNNLEAMAQWVHFARARMPFHLYVPTSAYEAARRLCEAKQARVSEIWTYRPTIEAFDLVRMFADASRRYERPAVTPRPSPRRKAGAARPVEPGRKSPVKPARKSARKPVRRTASKPAPRPARKAARKAVRKTVRKPVRKAARAAGRGPARKAVRSRTVVARKPARRGAKAGSKRRK